MLEVLQRAKSEEKRVRSRQRSSRAPLPSQLHSLDFVVLPLVPLYIAQNLFYSVDYKSLMPLFGVPNRISADLLHALARAGHGDKIVISDANFPSDSIAASATIPKPIRVNSTTYEILEDIMKLLPLDQYMENPIAVMDRVQSDKDRNLDVASYAALAKVSGRGVDSLKYIERFEFYETAKNAFVVIQTNDSALYANVIIYKGVVQNQG